MSRRAKEVRIFDADTGEIIQDVISYGTQNGDGWVIVYEETFMDFLMTAPDFTTAKVFGALMTKQEFDRGINTTKKALAERIGVSYRSVMNSFKWLKEHGYVKERKVNGQTEFLLNPDVTTRVKNRKKKIDMWNSV